VVVNNLSTRIWWAYIIFYGKIRGHRKRWLKLIDYYIVSHPKAGRTWLRTILAKAIAEHFKVPMQLNLLTIRRYNRRIPGIEFTHAKAGVKYRLRSPGRPEFTIPWHIKRKPVVFLARDPRDTVVSFYYQARKRRGAYNGSISEFIRDERLGIDSVVDFMNVWAGYIKENPDRVLLISYEQLHMDTVNTVRRVLDFVNLGSVSDETIRSAVTFASFENLRKLETQGYFQDEILRPADPSDPNSYKVRKGKIGSYLEELDGGDIEYVEQAIGRLDPLFGYKPGSLQR